MGSSCWSSVCVIRIISFDRKSREKADGIFLYTELAISNSSLQIAFTNADHQQGFTPLSRTSFHTRITAGNGSTEQLSVRKLTTLSVAGLGTTAWGDEGRSPLSFFMAETASYSLFVYREPNYANTTRA